MLALVGGSLGLLACALAWGMAGFVYHIAPTQPRNRLLALLLVFQGLEMGPTFGVGTLLDVRAGDPLWAPLRALNAIAFLAQPPLYVALLGTLDSALSRPFRRRGVQTVLAIVALLPFALWPWISSSLVTPTGIGPWYLPALYLHALAMVYGLIVALYAWRHAPAGSMTRARNRAFALAFGARDIVIGTQIVLFTFLFTPTPGTTLGAIGDIDYAIVVPLSVVALVLLMGYGMAKVQLFDVDVKLRIGARRGFVAGAFLVVFLVATQLVQALSTQAFGLVGGALAAGLLLFALRPIEHAAERFSRRAVPDARPLATLPIDQRAALYREQVALAWEDGVLGLKERRMLDASRARLGLGAEEALLLEQEALPAIGAR